MLLEGVNPLSVLCRHSASNHVIDLVYRDDLKFL